jgi:hypothetical protein
MLIFQVPGAGFEPDFALENPREIARPVGANGHERARIVPRGDNFWWAA